MTTDAAEEADRAAGRPSLRERSDRQHAGDVVAALSEYGERIRRREVREALDKLDAHGDLGDGQREVVETMASAIAGSLLAVATANLRKADDRSALDATVRLFDLDIDTDDGEVRDDGPYRPEVTSGDD